jgi:hypothetical protein
MMVVVLLLAYDRALVHPHFVNGTAEWLANDGRTTRIALGSQN